MEEEPSSLKQKLMEIATAPTPTEEPPPPTAKVETKPRAKPKRTIPYGPKFLSRKPPEKKEEKGDDLMVTKPPTPPPPPEEEPPPPPRPPTPIPQFILQFSQFPWFKSRFTEPYELVSY